MCFQARKQKQRTDTALQNTLRGSDKYKLYFFEKKIGSDLLPPFWSEVLSRYKFQKITRNNWKTSLEHHDRPGKSPKQLKWMLTECIQFCDRSHMMPMSHIHGKRQNGSDLIARNEIAMRCNEMQLDRFCILTWM